ncbi:hypothetical protein AVEN_162315-1 [Araneus ventricosus]|uniref:Uncharacterized protein n=1 Tax=Araneus ventricosus TaxID=182803 RepID=A0A4Y2USW3_ARAVE|nr:hypothetical protein AVEN_162315-1 [Araneus ventricosus]
MRMRWPSDKVSPLGPDLVSQKIRRLLGLLYVKPRVQTSSRWYGVEVSKRCCKLRCRPRHHTMVQNYDVRPNLVLLQDGTLIKTNFCKYIA